MWRDIVGHEGVIDMLRGFIRERRIPHALLFAGPEGVGKTMAAREFFKAINCLESPGDACGSCPSCRKAAGGSHPDLIVVSPAEDRRIITVDEIRKMIAEVGLKPFEASTRVVVIEPAELMHKSAANALLKTLEEPPDSTVLVLVSHRPSLLLPTIVSRCRTLRFTHLAAASSGGAADQAFLRLTSGTLSGIGGIDAALAARMRSELIQALLEGDSLRLAGRYFPTQEKAADVLPVVVLLSESVIRDLYVLSRGGEDLVNSELKGLPGSAPGYQDLEEAAACLSSIRQGAGENISLPSAFSELFMRLQHGVGSLLST